MTGSSKRVYLEAEEKRGSDAKRRVPRTPAFAELVVRLAGIFFDVGIAISAFWMGPLNSTFK